MGWAIDETGNVTNDAKAGLRGALLAFGGAKGANVALMVECLAAGLSGASWSLDMPDLDGDQVIDAAMTIITIMPTVIDEGFSTRLSEHLDRLAERGAYVPGHRSVQDCISEEKPISIDTAVPEKIRRYL